MNWLTQWMDRRRVKELQAKIEEMKAEAEAAKDDRLMLSARTVTHRVELLERAVQTLEQRTAGSNRSHA